MTNAEIRRQLTGNMPMGENRLAGREDVVEDSPSASDYEADAWIEIKDGSHLAEIVRGWAEMRGARDA